LGFEHALFGSKAVEIELSELKIADAKPLVATSAGFYSRELHPISTDKGVYIPLVKSASIVGHRLSFRRSDRYQP
jgi:hypothetical protein